MNVMPTPSPTTDGLEPELDIEAFRAGRRFPEALFTLEPSTVEQYRQVTGETLAGPRALGAVPPLFLTLVRFLKQSVGGRWPSGTLQLDQGLEWYRPLQLGETLSLDAEVTDLGIQPGRTRFVLTSLVRDTHRRIVAQQRSAALWRDARQPTPPTAGNRQAPPAMPPGAITGNAHYPLDALRAFGRLSGALDPIHIDPNFARQTRFGRNVVQGRLLLAQASRLMTQYFGETWWNGGRLDVRFCLPLMVDDTATAWLSPLPDTPHGGYPVGCQDSAGRTVWFGHAHLGNPLSPPHPLAPDTPTIPTKETT